MDHPFRPIVSCHTFQRQVYHFQAGELPEADREALVAHAAACPGCARRLAIEDAFLGALKMKLQRAPVPPELRERVRAALRREPHRRRPHWLRSPWLVPLAASALVALGLVVIASPGSSHTGVVPVDREVLVVDPDCDRSGASLERQQACVEPQHLNALKVGNAVYWNVGMDDDAFRRLVVDPTLRGHRLRVRGELFPRIRTLRLTDYEDLGTSPPPLPAQDAPAVVLAAP
jgi:anti-sigma factor (TIGR02949 family)